MLPVTIRAHFDGKVIVPDEPVDWPVGRSIRVSIDLQEEPRVPSVEERRAALRRLAARAVPGVNIPEEALRRENLYEERI